MTQNRRAFIKTTAVASAAVAILPSCLTSSPRDNRIGLQLYTVRNEMQKDPKGTLQQVAKIGYKKIESAGYDQGKLYGSNAKEFKSLINDLDLEFVSGHLSLNVFEEAFDEALEFMQVAGQEYAVFPWLAPEQRVSLDQYRGYAELLNRCAEKAAPAGIKVCYHNHDFEFQQLEGKLPMDVLLDEIDPKLVALELDLYWISRVGLNPVLFMMNNPQRIPLWHVKDMAATPDQGFEEVGEGTINFGEIFTHADVSGMKHFFVEQDQSENPMESIAVSYKNLKEILVG